MPIPTHFGFLSHFAKLELEAQHHIAYISTLSSLRTWCSWTRRAFSWCRRPSTTMSSLVSKCLDRRISMRSRLYSFGRKSSSGLPGTVFESWYLMIFDDIPRTLISIDAKLSKWFNEIHDFRYALCIIVHQCIVPAINRRLFQGQSISEVSLRWRCWCYAELFRFCLCIFISVVWPCENGLANALDVWYRFASIPHYEVPEMHFVEDY